MIETINAYLRQKLSILKFALGICLVLSVMDVTSSIAQTNSSTLFNGTDSVDVNSDIRQFCGNIADAARDKRYLIQRQELEKLQAQVDERIDMLKVHRDDYKEWLDKRNDFLATAEAGLVEIFKKMKPDAAAAQLEIIDKNIAAAIIMKLNPSLSSRIFNEMDSKIAARLATIIATVVKDEEENA